MEVLQPVWDLYNYYETELTDPRSKKLLLIRKPSIMFAFIAVYLLLITYILPTFMKNRKAYNLKKPILYYNIFQVVTNACIVYMCLGSGYGRRFSFTKCRDIDYSETDSDALLAFYSVYCYTLLKFTEFFDTFFFILRKKDNQVSFLHVYHHATMVFNAWLALKFVPGGFVVIPGCLNASVHVVMYTYYLLSGLGPKWQKYVWWKKYLTSFQIIQFIAGLSILIMNFMTSEACPKIMRSQMLLTYGGLYTASLLYMFSKFYKTAYTSVASKPEMNGKAHKVKNS